MDLTWEVNNNLSPALCKEIIERFENDGRKKRGHTSMGYAPEIKNSIDLPIAQFLEWEDICNVLDQKLRQNIKAYQTFLNNKLPTYFDISSFWHSGYQIQKSGHYRWHHDERMEYGRERVLTFIWYLNTIENGGHTGFLHKTIKPEMGKFVFFPATWDYIHCGFEAKDKYIITGWLWRDRD